MVKDIMTPPEKLVIVKPNESAAETFMKFSKHEVHSIPVVESEKLVGIVSRSDVFRIIKK